MLDEGNTLNMMETPDDAPPPEEKSNRTFLIVGGIMAALVFLTLVCMAVYFLVIAPRISAQRSAAQATIEAGNAQSAQQVTLTAIAALWTPTVPSTPIPSNTPVSSPTPVIALNSPVATSNVAILSAQQTQLALQLTSTAAARPTSGVGEGGMPTTGFFDEIGLPSMIILAFALVAVIFLARRMRKSPAK